MMYPERMERIIILAPEKHLRSTIELLHRHRVLHIVDHTKGRLDIGSTLPGSEQLADLLVKARSLIHSLQVSSDTKGELSGNLSKQLLTIHQHTTELFSRQHDAEEQLHHLRSEQAAYEGLRWLKVNPIKLRDSKHLTYFFGTIKDAKGLAEAIAAITQKHYLELQPQGSGMLLLIENEEAKQAKELLSPRGFNAADHQRIVLLQKPIDNYLKDIERGIAESEMLISQISHQLSDLGNKYGPFLVASEAFLAVESKKAQAPLRFAVTKYSFFISGWVPQEEIVVLQSDLEQELKGEVFMQRVSTTEEAPVKLDNVTVVSPYEALIKLYTLPKYWEIDPSTVLFLSFPVFFGFMLGDIGYGITVLLLAIFMRSLAKSELVKSIASILIMSSVATVIFGCIFGEFFGLESIAGHELPSLVHRTTGMTTLLVTAIAIGVIHITIALAIGFINEAHHHGKWKAFCSKISWVLLLGAACLIAAGVALKTQTLIAGAILAGVSIVLIVIGEGVRGLIELPGIFSNIMSYSRLMAIGVASASLALVVNQISGQLFQAGILGIAGGILVLLLGHTINLGLGIMGPFLHSLRLHYVEFFTKFYEGGGKPYKPFGADET